MVDSSADLNCISEGIIPSRYYTKNATELERGAPRLVINYKPLNKVLKWIRYPIPNKRHLLNSLYKARIFSKFDMNSGYWQIQIHEKDKYKTTFNVPFGYYEWNVMPFRLKNAPSEFQHIMNEIYNPYMDFTIVYIDDVLIFSQNIEQHFKNIYINFFEKVDDQPYTIQKVYAKAIKDSIKEPTIAELKAKINEIKSELFVLKEQVHYLEKTSSSVKREMVIF